MSNAKDALRLGKRYAYDYSPAPDEVSWEKDAARGIIYLLCDRPTVSQAINAIAPEERVGIINEIAAVINEARPLSRTQEG